MHHLAFPLLDTTSSSGAAATSVGFIIGLAVGVFYLAAQWVIFAKAGKPGWAAIIPIYSSVVFYRVSGHSGWWALLSIIPVVGLVLVFIATIDTARAFGHGVGYGLGLFFLGIFFYPMLAFGSSRYVGNRERVSVAY